MSNSERDSTPIWDALEAPESHDELMIDLAVTGGAPGERFVLEIRADNEGTATYRYLDELRGVEELAGTGQISSDRWRNLAAAMAQSTLGDETRPTVVPDSVVVRWSASLGARSATSLRAVDELSAADQAVVDATYEAAADLIGSLFAPPNDQ